MVHRLWVFKKPGQHCFKTKLQVRRATSTLGGSQEESTLATQDWLGGNPDPDLPLLCAKPGQVPILCILPPRPHQTKYRRQMAAVNPSHLTMSYDGSQGDREFIFSCKGRPFSVLTAPNFPTPPSTMIDYNLVRDLKLRMTPK